MSNEYRFLGFYVPVSGYCQPNLYLCIYPKNLLDEQYYWNGYLFFHSHKAAVIGDNFGEEMTHMLANLFWIEMLQTTVARIMGKYHDKHYFHFGCGGITVIFALCGGFKCIFCHHGIKKACKNYLSDKIIL